MAKEEQTGAGRKQAKPRAMAAPASHHDEMSSAQKGGADSTDSIRSTPNTASTANADEDSAGGSTYLVPGLERGLRILSEFSAREPVLGAPELSKRIGIPRTTTFQIGRAHV